jgi:hypothetical protein
MDDTFERIVDTKISLEELKKNRPKSKKSTEIGKKRGPFSIRLGLPRKNPAKKQKQRHVQTPNNSIGFLILPSCHGTSYSFSNHTFRTYAE